MPLVFLGCALNICPRCSGQLLHSYGEEECIQCGFVPEIILTQQEISRQLKELVYVSDREIGRWLAEEQQEISSEDGTADS